MNTPLFRMTARAGRQVPPLTPVESISRKKVRGAECPRTESFFWFLFSRSYSSFSPSHAWHSPGPVCGPLHLVFRVFICLSIVHLSLLSRHLSCPHPVCSCCSSCLATVGTRPTGGLPSQSFHTVRGRGVRGTALKSGSVSTMVRAATMGAAISWEGLGVPEP